MAGLSMATRVTSNPRLNLQVQARPPHTVVRLAAPGGKAASHARSGVAVVTTARAFPHERAASQSWGRDARKEQRTMRDVSMNMGGRARRSRVGRRSIDEASTDSGNGGGGVVPPPGDNGGGGGGGSGDDEEPEPVLGAESAAVEKMFKENAINLPADMQLALTEGRLTLLDAERWVAICKGPFASLANLLPALREKMLGNPRLMVTIGIELLIGCTAKMIAEVGARKDLFWKELDFVFSDMMLEIVADFSLVWLLSPSRMLKPTPSGALARTIAGLPGHMFQKGNFALWQRASTVAYRGAQFFCVGVLSTLLGHGSTIALVNSRPKTKDQKELSPLVKTSAVWASFMVLSSNFRYQTVNGIEDRFLDAVLTGGPRNLATFFLRFGNCYLGGVQWVWFARLTGLQ